MKSRLISSLLLLLCILSPAVFAETLQVSADSPYVFHLGAALLLYSHIVGGAVGLVSGVVASASKKGDKLHRASGKVFFYAMFISYLIGALVAPFLEQGQRPNFVAGVLALYLLLSGVHAARKRKFSAGMSEKIGLIVAALITAMGFTFMFMGFNSDSGTVDGSPPQAFVLFIVAGTAATIGEIRVLLKGKLSQAERVVRHLWRMCFSFFIASGSLFFGQPQVFPDWFAQSIWAV